jgi:uroporphyrinogen-III synthase
MSGTVVVLRPEPGASETASRAQRLGLCAVKAPLFTIRPIAWQAPDADGYEAILLTSANAPRHGGEALGRFLALPCFAVGEATAAAAREAGFSRVSAGPSDGAAAVETMAAAGVSRALHLCGLDHLALEHERVEIDRAAVYSAEPGATLPRQAQQVIAAGALVLVHSPRAARRLAELVEVRGPAGVAAISEAAAEAAGEGWSFKAVAREPRDSALLELAARLCNYGGAMEGSGGTDGL